ncbi:MAG: Asp-tRNA(Asn)/Glu-tRNA(Gln) amidotransferase subunit GatC [Candidatus Moranbacteria bacterium]|nr:Asp-tRNA(Asn)/Glu-tRNA(Gln) amidotransferase subunit GatC [Candidatus Moranbacteria bacterium]
MPKKNITPDQLEKTAQLARISLTEKEKKKFFEELEEILDYFNYIQEAPTGKAEAFDHYSMAENRLREDEAIQSKQEEKEGIKKNFPEKKEGYLKVKTVLKRG